MRTARQTLLSIALSISFVAIIHAVADLPPAAVKFINETEDVVRRIANHATELHSRRRDLVKSCTCSLPDCTNDFEGECDTNLTTPDVCGKTEGRLVNYSTTIVRIPGDMNSYGLSAKIKENICVYKGIQNKAEESGRHNLGWIYLGTREGDFRRWPATPFWRDEPDGNPHLGGCRQYDPRMRPWFIAAIAGPKDVVILVDRSQSMDKHHYPATSAQSRWGIAKNSVNRLLDTFSHHDFVSVVPFSNTSTLNLSQLRLMKATEENKALMNERLEGVKLEGTANATEAFKIAFNLLENSCEQEGKHCSDCQKIILFFTDGEFGSDEEALKPSKTIKLIAKFQKRLKERSKQKATIFTYSITNQANDRLPRHIACANDGIWSLVEGAADPLDALRSYFAYVAAGRKTDTPIWIEPYEDAGGLGTVTTVAIPFYSRESGEEPAIFLGVVGLDVRPNEFIKVDADTDRALEDKIEHSPPCKRYRNPFCHLQSYRNIHGTNSLCLLSETNRSRSNQICLRFAGRFYKHFSKRVSQEKAASRCRKNGGALVSIGSSGELALLTRLASADGSWTGAKYVNNSWLSTPNSSVPESSTLLDFWATKEPRHTDNQHACAAIDTRGIAGNLFSLPCSHKLSYICEYESDASCTEGIEDAQMDLNCPAVNASRTVEEDTSGAGLFSSSRVLCGVGKSKSSQEVMCCRPPTQTQTQTKTKTESTQLQPVHIVFLALGGTGAVLAIAALVYNSGVFKPQK